MEMQEIILLRKILTKMERFDDELAKDRARETLYEKNVIILMTIIGNRMTTLCWRLL